jgi:hypothetical protein
MAVMTTTFEQARFDLCEFETDPFTCGQGFVKVGVTGCN